MNPTLPTPTSPDAGLSRLERALLPRLVAGTLPGGPRGVLARWLRARLPTRPALAQAYDALMRLERAESGESGESGGDGLTTSQMDWLEASLLANVDGVEETARAPARAGARTAAPWAAAASLAAVAFLVVSSPRDALNLGDLQARGARLAQDPVGVRVDCVADGRVLASVTGGARQSGASLRCPDDGLLAFATTNLAKDTRYLFVLGVAEDGLRFYAPFEASSAAVTVKPGDVDVVQDTLARIRDLPRDERVSLFVLVSDRPFDGASLSRQLDRAARQGLGDLRALDRLPVDVPLQARLELLR